MNHGTAGGATTTHFCLCRCGRLKGKDRLAMRRLGFSDTLHGGLS